MPTHLQSVPRRHCSIHHSRGSTRSNVASPNGAGNVCNAASPRENPIMPRPRKYASRAEQQAAYPQRCKDRAANVTPIEVEVDDDYSDR